MPSPSQNGGPHARPSSPVSGRSTLTTSAPSAARIWAQYGPAIDVVTSSTRAPSSGLCTARIIARLCDDAAAVFDQFKDWVSGAVVELRGDLRRLGDRRVLPPRPERERRHHRRHTSPRAATSGCSGVILSASAGAIVGDNISYVIGMWAGERTVKRVFRGEKSRKASIWAEHQLEARGFYIIVIARFIPGGRTAVTFASGLHPRDDVAPLHRRRRLRRAPLGNATPRCSATSAARPFEDAPVEGPAPRVRHRGRRRGRRRGRPLVPRERRKRAGAAETAPADVDS